MTSGQGNSAKNMTKAAGYIFFDHNDVVERPGRLNLGQTNPKTHFS